MDWNNIQNFSSNIVFGVLLFAMIFCAIGCTYILRSLDKLENRKLDKWLIMRIVRYLSVSINFV